MENHQETQNVSVPPPVMPHQLSEDEFESCDEQNVESENDENSENEENSVGASEASDSEEDPADSDPTITCQICYNKFGIYTIAQCNHGMCLTCMLRIKTKLPASGQEDHSNECPTCREAFNKIYVSTEYQEYENFSPRMANFDRRHKLHLVKADESLINREIAKITSNICYECSSDNSVKRFVTLKQWIEHQGKEHKMHACKLCVANQTFFTFEIQLYQSRDLGKHRKAEHPRCRFCDEQFYDRNGLYKHLRNDHEYCRICENISHGGNMNYYDGVEEMKEHLQTEHFLCQHADCWKPEEKGYLVFRTEPELKIHTADEHSGNAKSNKTRITLAGLPSGSREDASREDARQKAREKKNPYFYDREARERENNQIVEETNQLISTEYNVEVENFPSLGGDSASAGNKERNRAEAAVKKSQARTGTRLNQQLADDQCFPTLGGGPPKTLRKKPSSISFQQPQNVNSTKKSSKLSNKSKSSSGLNAPSQVGFPGLQKPAKKPKKTNKKPALNAGPNPLKSGPNSPEDFVPTEYQPKWASVNKKGEEIQLDPTPVPVKQSANWAAGTSGGNFPSLAGGPRPSSGQNTGSKLGFSSNLAKKVAANPKSLLRTAAVPVHIKTRNAKLKQKANQDAKSVRNQNKNQNKTPTNLFPQKLPSNANNQRPTAPQSLIGQSSSNNSNSLINKSRNESKTDFYSAKNDPFRYEAETDFEFNKKFAKLNMMDSKGRQGGSGLVDGAHPLAPKFTPKEEVSEFSGKKFSDNNKSSFPGLKHTPAQGTNKKATKKSGVKSMAPRVVVDSGPAQWVKSDRVKMVDIDTPQPKVELEKPNLDSGRTFPGLGGGIKSRGQLSSKFKHATHPKFQEKVVDPWAASGLSIKQPKAKGSKK
jgi:hypothetical protein